MHHIAVLQQEVLSTLNPSPQDFIVDCTLGSGGHAELLCARLASGGVYLGIDQDPTALEHCQRKLGACTATVRLVHGNFRDIERIVSEADLGTPTAILADLGWRIEQFDGSTNIPRGFSFDSDEPIHMTYGDPSDYPFTAYDIVNEWNEEDIANVLYSYGQEHYSRRIAKVICEVRKKKSIDTASVLAEVIKSAVPKSYAHRKTHPATKTFQALRIAVNDEFDTLAKLLEDGFALLSPGGKMAIISFHSLEDKIVKEVFRTFVRDQRAMFVHKKPVVANYDELAQNPRARSAKLRTIQKIS